MKSYSEMLSNLEYIIVFKFNFYDVLEINQHFKGIVKKRIRPAHYSLNNNLSTVWLNVNPMGILTVYIWQPRSISIIIIKNGSNNETKGLIIFSL